MNKLYFVQAIVFVLLLTSCGSGESDAPQPSQPPANPTLTIAQQLAKTWRVEKAFLKGDDVTSTGEYNNFRMTLNASSTGQPSTYTITPGGAPSKPNWASNDTGNWALNGSNTQLTFDNTTTTSIIGTPTAEKLVLEWKVSIEVDKLEPTYRFELIPN